MPHVRHYPRVHQPLLPCPCRSAGSVSPHSILLPTFPLPVLTSVPINAALSLEVMPLHLSAGLASVCFVAGSGSPVKLDSSIVRSTAYRKQHSCNPNATSGESWCCQYHMPAPSQDCNATVCCYWHHFHSYRACHSATILVAFSWATSLQQKTRVWVNFLCNLPWRDEDQLALCLQYWGWPHHPVPGLLLGMSPVAHLLNCQIFTAC